MSQNQTQTQMQIQHESQEQNELDNNISPTTKLSLASVIDEADCSSSDSGSSTDEDDDYEEMELDEDAEAKMTKFTESAIAMCEIEDKIKELNATKRELTNQKNELKEEVIEFMKVKNVRINYGEDEVIYLAEKTTKGSLTKKKLSDLLFKFYDVDGLELEDGEETEINLSSGQRDGIKKAEQLLKYVESNLGESQKFDLVRKKQKAKKVKKMKSKKRKGTKTIMAPNKHMKTN